MVRTARHYSHDATRGLFSSGQLPDLSWMLGGNSSSSASNPNNPSNFIVTYNINNGIQVLATGRNINCVHPAPPPTYNEAVASAHSATPSNPPPVIEPPPPYVSHENLVLINQDDPLIAAPLLEPADLDELQEANNNGDINGNSVESIEENNNHVMDRNHFGH
jgi:hypothetical protein